MRGKRETAVSLKGTEEHVSVIGTRKTADTSNWTEEHVSVRGRRETAVSLK